MLTRRQLLARLGGGFGGVALASLMGESILHAAETYDLTPKKPNFEPKAKAVIQLFMHGGPSHVDLYDPKPMLDKFDGKEAPKEVADDEKITGHLLKSPYKFNQHGECGLPFAETLPHIASHADEIAVIRSMYTEHR